MTDLCVDSRNHRVKGLGGIDIDSLVVNFLNAHMCFLSFLLLVLFDPTFRHTWLSQEQCRKPSEILVKYPCSSPVNNVGDRDQASARRSVAKIAGVTQLILSRRIRGSNKRFARTDRR